MSLANSNLIIDELVQLIDESSLEKQIDWTALSTNREETIRLIASGVLEIFDSSQSYGKREIIMLSTIVRLMFENFVLNIKLQGK